MNIYTCIDNYIVFIGMLTNFEIINLTGYSPVLPINFFGVGLSFNLPTWSIIFIVQYWGAYTYTLAYVYAPFTVGSIS